MKFIDKRELPCFKYYKTIDYNLYCDYFDKILKLQEVLGNKRKIDTTDINILLHCFDTLPKKLFTAEAGGSALENVGKTCFEEWKKFLKSDSITIKEEIFLIRSIRSAYELLSLACLAYYTQGGELEGVYPKLFLISDKAYNNVPDHDDLCLLFDLLRDDISYCIAIQTEKREKKYMYNVRKYNDKIVVMIADRSRGMSRFQLDVNGDLRAFECFTSKMLGCEIKCDKDRSICKYNKMQSVYKVLVCLKKYLEVKDTMRYLPKQTQGKKHDDPNTKRKESNRKFRFENHISVYDYPEIKNDVKMIKSRRSDGFSGSPKAPHVRSGHTRHYKNGKTVEVRTTVIHKDLFDGHNQADRI